MYTTTTRQIRRRMESGRFTGNDLDLDFHSSFPAYFQRFFCVISFFVNHASLVFPPSCRFRAAVFFLFLSLVSGSREPKKSFGFGKSRVVRYFLLLHGLFTRVDLLLLLCTHLSYLFSPKEGERAWARDDGCGFFAHCGCSFGGYSLRLKREWSTHQKLCK